MSWYNKKQEWKNIIKQKQPSIIKLITSKQFLKQNNFQDKDVIQYLQKYFKNIIKQIFQYALIVPTNQSTHQRKYLYPTVTMDFMTLLFANYKMNKVQYEICIQELFTSFLKNSPQLLQLTLIPSYFQRLFLGLRPIILKDQIYGISILNRFIIQNQQIFNNLFKYLKFQQICDIFKETILINQAQLAQFNLPYLNKIQILIKLLQHLHRNSSQQTILNLLQTFIQVTQYQNKRDGKVILNEFSQDKNIKKYLLLLSNATVQEKCIILQTIKSIFLWRHSAIAHLDEIISICLIKSQQPTIDSVYLLGILISCLQIPQLISHTSQTIKSNNILQYYLQCLHKYPNMNILHVKIEQLIHQIFRLSIVDLMEYLYDKCNIISYTIGKINNYKLQSYYGQMIKIVKYYTTMRVQTKIIDNIIQNNKQIWKQFYSNILQPYVQLHKNKLGQNNYQIIQKLNQYSIKNYIKCQQQKLKQSNLKQLSDSINIILQENNKQQQDHIGLITLNSVNPQKQSSQNLDNICVNQPIQIIHNKSQIKHQKQSFQRFMEINKNQISNKGSLRKTRSLSKIKNNQNQQKINKWKIVQENQSIQTQPYQHKKNKHTKQTNQNQKQRLIKIIRFTNKKNSNKERLIEDQRDSKLKKLLIMIRK